MSEYRLLRGPPCEQFPDRSGNCIRIPPNTFPMSIERVALAPGREGHSCGFRSSPRRAAGPKRNPSIRLTLRLTQPAYAGVQWLRFGGRSGSDDLLQLEASLLPFLEPPPASCCPQGLRCLQAIAGPSARGRFAAQQQTGILLASQGFPRTNDPGLCAGLSGSIAEAPRLFQLEQDRRTAGISLRWGWELKRPLCPNWGRMRQGRARVSPASSGACQPHHQY